MIAPGSWRLCGPWDRRILIQREVSAPLVIVIEEQSKRAPERPLIPHDDVIEALSPQSPDQALREWILPRRARRGHDILGPEAVQEPSEVRSVDAVAISQQIASAMRSGKASRICCRVHAAVGWSVTFTWITRRRSCDRMRKTNSTRKVAVGTVKKSIDAHCDRCVRRNVRQVGDGHGGRRPRYFATVVSEMAMPNFWSSP